MSDTTPTAVPPLSASDERLWATLIHVGGIVFHFLPALIGYLVLRDRGAFIHQQTRTALNFQLTVLAGYIVGIFTSWFIVGLLVLLAVAALNIVFSVIAAVAANTGEHYEYPLAIRFIR
ncbi:DUF4870 domain-containing protein [Lacisediminihabitans changchengi]|uniref:DUF4870 domain-containing protein n=1 Tax=Lacisediminihabitans changchengi TaxID=2787634 RepID=A0A934W179_9MICO|nr:DUF4870 domain-containing protein [Lacisediminihabitans changchengi]MBK4346593.1 DUF4870 domain-containing protein [Lacisediminihabitans changchengi]